MASANNSSSALQRLQRDCAELARCPIAGICASPVQGNLFNWAVNMVASEGLWQGIVVHLHLTFPPRYPLEPPTVELKTDLTGHPNVFGDWICLDMLKEPGIYARPYQGWSSAYTLSAILTQLCGFLLVDDNIDQMGGGDYRAQRRSIGPNTGKRNCPCAFHDLPVTADAAPAASNGASNGAAGVAGVAPPPSLSKRQVVPMDDTETGGGAAVGALEMLGSQVDRLDDHLLRGVLGSLGPEDLHRASAAGGRVGRVARDVLQRSELVCFESKQDFTKVLLGFGVSRAWHHDMRAVRGLSAKADYLSWEAFQQGVRKSVWNLSFDAFLPLYLNPEHGKRCLKELPHFTRAILDSSCTSGRLVSESTAVNPQELMSVLGQLINSLVVEMMGGTVQSSVPVRRARTPYDDGYNWDEETAPQPSVHEVTRAMSDSALQAFCHLHHLLLAVALQPGSRVLQLARERVTCFMRDPAARTKARTPDIGVLLVDYLLVPREEAPWAQFGPVFVREVLARQVRWAIKEKGDWFASPHTESISATGESRDDFNRLKMHFDAGVVGLRLTMMQAWFANALARPSSVASMSRDLAAIKSAYDECSGLPPPRTFEAFNAAARRALKCGSWVEFLTALRMGFSTTCGMPPRALFAACLRQAVVDSHRAGYHRGPIPAPPAAAQPQRRLTADDWREAPGRGRAAQPGWIDWERVKPLGVVSEVWV